MASTRAEALARYARSQRVWDVTEVRTKRRVDVDETDHWVGPPIEPLTPLDAISPVQALRALILLAGGLAMTPVLPMLLSQVI